MSFELPWMLNAVRCGLKVWENLLSGNSKPDEITGGKISKFIIQREKQNKNLLSYTVKIFCDGTNAQIVPSTCGHTGKKSKQFPMCKIHFSLKTDMLVDGFSV